jgi:catechol 2,3-dioxygenase-like lactoylglutathione lyase family enzyme/uncharacterized protein YunC (DUF1805 family)
MSEPLPRTTHRDLQFENGRAIGLSHRWEKGQYCAILTRAGIVGCGIYDLVTPAEFGQAIAIAKGTPACPLTEPEDLFDARIVGVTPGASAHGVRVGMSGREAVELMLKAMPSPPVPPGIRVKDIDHVTLVVKDLERSRGFYVGVLGMREVPRPAFSFAGSWFQAGRTQVHLILEYDGSGPAGNLAPEDKRHMRSQHVAFAVDHAAAAVSELAARGVTVIAGPKPRPDGYVQVFVHDPDGHVVELCSPPPAG